MKEKLHKRIVFLTNSLLALFSVCVIYFLHGVDTWSKKDDLIAINTVIESNDKLDITDDFDFNLLDEKIRRWLNRSDEQLYRANRSSREKLSYYLESLGYPIAEIRRVKGHDPKNEKIFTMTRIPGIETLIGRESNNIVCSRMTYCYLILR